MSAMSRPSRSTPPISRKPCGACWTLAGLTAIERARVAGGVQSEGLRCSWIILDSRFRDPQVSSAHQKRPHDMTQQTYQPDVTEALLIIGREILSGRTKDANLPF